jgi:hypothetical protein
VVIAVAMGRAGMGGASATRSAKRHEMGCAAVPAIGTAVLCDAMELDMAWDGLRIEERGLRFLHSARLGVRALCFALAPLGHCQTRMVVGGGWREFAAIPGSKIPAQCALGSEVALAPLGHFYIHHTKIVVF